MSPALSRLLRSGPVVGGAYLLAWLAAGALAQAGCALPFGLRFGAFLLLPVRRWAWLVGAELIAVVVLAVPAGLPLGWAGLALGELPELLVVMAGLWLLRRLDPQAGLQWHIPLQAVRLLLAALLITLAACAADAAVVAALHHAATRAVLADALGRALVGRYLGVLLLVPLMVLLLRAQPSHPARHRLLLDGVRVLLPALAILLLCAALLPHTQFALALSLTPALYFAFRHGWRGASVATVVAMLGVTGLDRHLGVTISNADDLFLAIAVSGTLMLGSASDALRLGRWRMAEQNARLAAANQRLDQLARQLRAAARGNLQADENRRRHLAAELHDELGQNITAIQTHVKLAQARLQRTEMDDIGISINQILAHMRSALHRLLDDLRPAVLDEFGLLRALDEGPIRTLLDAAGVRYRTELHGDPRALDDDTRTAIYRLAQECATNTVKHAHAAEFRLRLRIGPRPGTVLALVDLRDDGIGLPDQPGDHGGRGLRGMRDRVTSLGGVFRQRPVPRGMRLRVLLRCAHHET